MKMDEFQLPPHLAVAFKTYPNGNKYLLKSYTNAVD
jgi:hypothetical protein